MREPRRIASRDNPLYRQLLSLVESSRERRQLGVSVLEGIHLCDAFLAAGGVPRLCVVGAGARAHPEVGPLLARAAGAAGALRPADPALATSGAPAFDGGECELADPLFRSLSQVASGVAIAFVIDTPRAVLPDRIERDAVYLDALQDPGNVGTILRSCAAAGVSLVITAPTTAWCWSPKVLRAAMGAHFALTVVESVAWQAVAERATIGGIATSPHARDTLWQADLRGPALWRFGTEGKGLDAAQVEAGTRWLRIPQRAGVESMNVAAAVAVCLFEQRRQREAARAC